jgi:aminoacrylate hydrolase
VPTLRTGDDQLYYEEHGAGAPLLLVPGLSGVGTFWDPQVPGLARDFRVIVHDHRGTGRSTHARIRYSVDQMADDVLRLMDSLGIASAHLVGHSTGGAIGQTLAQDHPARVRSLVLSASWAGPDPYFRRCFESRREVLLTLGVEAYLRASALFVMPPAWIGANDAALAEQHRQQAAAAAPVEVTASRIDAIVRFDRRARLHEVRTPTLVVVAADDALTPVFYSRELADRVPGAKLVVLEGGGHYAPVAAAEAWAAAVGAFLRAQPAS